MASIDTPLLIVGGGPAALVAAQVASGSGLGSLVVGHTIMSGDQPETLDAASVATLEPHGVLGVLRPYAASQDPFAITPALFDEVLKHHCVVDMIITVYDGMWVEADVLTDGKARWDLHADASIDTSAMATDLNAAIAVGATAARAVLANL